MRPERLTLWICLSLLAGLSWVYLLLMDAEMRAMAGTGATLGLMWMMPMGGWGAPEFILALAMWVIMMVGMMIPSALPMIVLFEKVQRRANAPAALHLTFCFVGGYALVWSIFSLVATILQFVLTEWGLYSDFMESHNPWLRGAICIAAGVYQFTALKHACLTQCQSPLGFLTRHWQSGRHGALRMGVRHGYFCLGCCWLLMLVLFAVGIMNLVWILALSILVLAEKLVVTRWFTQLIGAALMAWGMYQWVMPG